MTKKSHLQAEPTQNKRVEDGDLWQQALTPAAGRATSRQGKKQIGAWLDPDYDRSLLLIMAKARPFTNKQKLIAEALNDLFRKYDVPVVSED